MSNLSFTMQNREIDAKEIELANTRLDTERSQCSGEPSGSYLQVVVEKHAGVARLASRLPAASSPLRAEQRRAGGGAGDAARAAANVHRDAAISSEGEPDLAGDDPPRRNSPWRTLRESDEEQEDARDVALLRGDSAEPEVMEVYRFERVGLWLSAGGGGGRATRVERRAARAARAARSAAAELGAAARLAASAPLRVAELGVRCALQVARDAAAAAVLAASDYALKPALALAFNALLHPVLVFVGHVLRGVRAALRPACGAARECAAPAADLLRAVRLVEVTLHAPPPAACACRDQRSQHSYFNK